ncbi:hypothetical protein BGX34_009929 [Mortierella sp. NVP85]|nr:hypothetical protein BGX34_009929 [Mortierella sp. NVP85]
MQQPGQALHAEIDQLKRSVDSMNSQTADMLKGLESLRHIGADHMALPSTDQEKLDREWEYFETVCDQVYFILENTRYKLKRQQDALYLQLNPPAPVPTPVLAPEPEPVLQENVTTLEQTPVSMAISDPAPIVVSAPAPEDPLVNLAILDTAQQDMQAISTPITSQQTSSLSDIQLPQQSSAFDLEMLSPPSNFDLSMGTDQISTAALLSATVPAMSVSDTSLMNNAFISEEDALQSTMLDLGNIGSLGDDGLGDMDDLINF